MARKPVKAANPTKTIRRHKHQKDVARPHFNRPRLLVRPPLLTAAQVLKTVWPGDKERGEDIAVKQLKKIRTPKALPGYIVYRVATLNKSNKHIHRVTILFDGRVGPNSKVIVDSDTWRWVFFYEYAMAKRGNAFIWRSNGEEPMRTNPRHKPGIDKHIYVALRYVLRARKAGELPA